MIRLLVLALLLATPLRADPFPALHAVTGVASDDVLNIREQPAADAAVIGTLAPDATGIEVLGLAGTWAIVATAESTGYVASRFLVREPGPSWSMLQGPLVCLGTEPFWSLEIDPKVGETRYRTPEDPAPDVHRTDRIWPAEPWARLAAVGVRDGLAVLRAEACSDGMSDRSYGIAVDIFQSTEAGAARQTGCCRLVTP